jgi:hypothetical protein
MKKRAGLILLTIAASTLVFGVVGWTVIGPTRWEWFLQDRADNVPLKFYGRVVDANGKPIPGARIQWQIRTHNVLSLFGGNRNSTFTGATVTNVNGDFQIKGYTGNALWIMSIDKDDYKWLKRSGPGNLLDNDSYTYAPSSGSTYTPNPDNPAIFPMAGIADKPGAKYYLCRGGSTEGVPGQPEEVKPPTRRR